MIERLMISAFVLHFSIGSGVTVIIFLHLQRLPAYSGNAFHAAQLAMPLSGGIVFGLVFAFVAFFYYRQRGMSPPISGLCQLQPTAPITPEDAASARGKGV